MTTSTSPDLDRVPPYPVVAIEISDPDSPDATLSVAGQPVTLDNDAHDLPALVELGGRTAAEHVAGSHLQLMRAAAIIRRPGQAPERHVFIVGADGSRYEVPGTEEKARTRHGTGTTPRQRGQGGNTRGTIIVLAVLAAVVALIVALLLAFALHYRATAQPVQTPQAPPPTELPVLPPDGATTHADWSVAAIGTGARVVALPSHRLATIADNALVVLDARSGATLASTSPGGTARFSDGPWLTNIDGTQVIAAVTTTGLVWWSLDLAQAGSLPLPAEGTVNISGTTPVLILPGQHAQIPTAHGSLSRLIPAGSVAVRADGSTLTTLDPTTGQVWHIDTDAQHVPDPAITLARPTDATGGALLGTIGNTIVIAWNAPAHDGTTSTTVALYDLYGGTKLASAKTTTYIGAGADQTDWIAGTRFATVAGTLIDTQQRSITAIHDGGHGWRTSAIVDGHIYGHTSTGDLATLTADGTIHPQINPDAPSPTAADENHVYVVTTDAALNEKVLYALQRR